MQGLDVLWRAAATNISTLRGKGQGERRYGAMQSLQGNYPEVSKIPVEDFAIRFISSSFFARMGSLLARPAIERFRAHFDPRRYNGAMLLGLTGICVKSHGGTDEIGFAQAIEVGVNLVRLDFNE